MAACNQDASSGLPMSCPTDAPLQLAAPFLGQGRGFSRARLGVEALSVVWFTSLRKLLIRLRLDLIFKSR